MKETIQSTRGVPHPERGCTILEKNFKIYFLDNKHQYIYIIYMFINVIAYV